MPFTFSHPAIILPLIFLPRKWISWTGLIVGSLVPDFEYFLRMKIQSEHSHTISGLFYFDLPLGILLAFVFHNIIRDRLVENLPLKLKSRLIGFKNFNWNYYFKNNFFVVIICILIGAASHLFWDSFTHENAYFVQAIPVLTNNVDFLGKQVYVWKILQHLSSLLGGIAIVFTLFKIKPKKNLIGDVSLKYWIILALLTLLITMIRILAGLDYELIGHLVVSIISAGLISLILVSYLMKPKITSNKKA